MRRERNNIELATKIAWLHYIGGHTQASISKKLGFSTARINRLLTFARQNNIVQFSIHGDLSSCAELENHLKEKFGFEYCKVVPNLNENTPIPLKALGIAGATFIEKQITQQNHAVIGLGYGQTMSACINYIQHRDSCDIEFVSLSGGLTPQFSISPYDVIHRIAYRINAKSYIIPAPMYMASLEEKQTLLDRPEFQAVFNKITESSLKIVGIGTVDEHASTLQTGIWAEDTLLHLKKQGAVGEILGHFFNADGQALELDFTNKMITPPLDNLKETCVFAIAGGAEKTSAIRAISKSGYLEGLITDEQTAENILKDNI